MLQVLAVVVYISVYVCRAREWTGQFVTDYQELFPGIIIENVGNGIGKFCASPVCLFLPLCLPGAAFYVPVGESADHEVTAIILCNIIYSKPPLSIG